jgi:hypothetical protein
VSATIKWTPTGTGKVLSVHAPSSFLEILGRMCGQDRPPFVIGAEDVPKLEGVVAASDEYRAEDFKRLLKAIEDHGEIRLWAEY